MLTVNVIEKDIVRQLFDLHYPTEKMGRVYPLDDYKDALDNPQKYVVHASSGNPKAFIKISRIYEPAVVAHEMELMRLVKESVGSKLGSVVSEPLLSGSINGLSYMVIPYFWRLSGHRYIFAWQRKMLIPALLDWLKELNNYSLRTPSIEQLNNDFIIPLQFISNDKEIAATIRAESDQAARRLQSGIWKPKYVVSHNDVHVDNIMLRDRYSGLLFPNKMFTLIDWEQATINGYAIIDLVRMSSSLCLPDKLFTKQVFEHCHILNCQIIDSKSYLLASLGSLGMNGKYFPRKKYLEYVDWVCRYLFDRLESVL